jgi:hypothetical protein
MKNDFTPRELRYLRVDNGFSSLSDSEISAIRTLEPVTKSDKRDTITFHIDQFYDIEELADLYKYMNERKCILMEFYVPKGIETKHVNRNRKYHFSDKYVSREEALEFCKKNNARLLAPEELKRVVKGIEKYHINKEDSDGRMYFSLGNGHTCSSYKYDKAKLVAKFL